MNPQDTNHANSNINEPLAQPKRVARLVASQQVSWHKEKPLLFLVLFTSVFYSVLSLLRHWHFGSNTWDLGNFDQMVWHYSRFEAPASTTLGLANSLGDHFSPMLALCAPLYWIYPHAETLLVLQAVLFGITVIPIFLFAEKRLGRKEAYCLATAFVFFWGVQNTIEYDFHPDVFAVPLIAFAIYWIDLEKWLGAALAIVGLLFVKEDLTLLVSAFGVYLALKQKIKWGLLLMAIGLVFFYLEVSVWVPYFHGGEGYYQHWIYSNFGKQPSDSLMAVIQNPFLIFDVLFSNGARIKTLFLLFASFLFLPLFSWQMLLIVPLAASKLLADSPNYWGMAYHYSATLCPILVMASAEGLVYWRKKVFLKRGIFKKLLPAPTYILVINLILIPVLSPWKGVEHSAFWTLNSMEKTSALVFALIPPNASVATQSSIAPHLSERKDIYSFGSNVDCQTIHPNLIVLNPNLNCWPITYAEIATFVKTKKDYKTIFDQDGWIVMEQQNDRAIGSK